MRSADLTLRLPASMQLPVPDLTATGTIYREEVLSWELDDERDRIRFLSVVTGDLEAVEGAVEAIETSTSIAVYRSDLTPIDADRFYAYVELSLRESDLALFEPFDRSGMVIVPPIVYTGEETVRFTALGEPDALAGLLESLPPAVGVDVERVSDHRRRSEILAGRLTGRQLEALAAARAVGYYEVPREGTLAEVAAELECSESAASRLLRSAEARLVDATL